MDSKAVGSSLKGGEVLMRKELLKFFVYIAIVILLIYLLRTPVVAASVAMM